MIIKTRGDLFYELQAAVKEHHPYEVPEISPWLSRKGFLNTFNG